MSDLQKPPSRLGLGIDWVESIGNWMRGVGIRAGFVPLQWDHERRPGLIWRVPDPEIVAASVFSRIQGVLVREYEHAVVLHNGVAYSDLTSGVYDIRKLPIKDFVEIIWVSTQISQHKWGVGRVINRENITIGAHGLIFLQVADARQFLLNVVAGKSRYTQAELEDWVFGIVSGVMRTQIAASTIRDLMEGQEEFAQACGARLAQAFAEWGIAFKNLIINQFDVPEEYRQAIAQVTIALAQKQSTIIAAEAEAAARLTTGGADVELMRRMMAMGIDPAKIKAVEALGKYAELAAQTPGGGRDGPTDMLSMLLFTQMARGMMGDQGAAGGGVSPQALAAAGAAAPVLTPPAGSPPAGDAYATMPVGQQPPATPEEERARIQRTLDNLDERLAAGEISEATYERLRAKWEEKLREVGGA